MSESAKPMNKPDDAMTEPVDWLDLALQIEDEIGDHWDALRQEECSMCATNTIGAFIVEPILKGALGDRGRGVADQRVSEADQRGGEADD